MTDVLHVNCDHFRYSTTIAHEARCELDVPETAVTVLVAGRPTRQKRGEVRRIVSRCAQLAGDVVHRVLVVGYGPDFAGAGRYPNPGAVSFHPFASPDQLPRLLCAADLVVYGAPSVGIQQALCTGAALVVAHHATVDYLADVEGVIVELYDPSRPSTLEDAVRAASGRLNTDMSKRSDRAAAAAQRFSIEHVLDLVLRRVDATAGPP
jgi:hypothetical protein